MPTIIDKCDGEITAIGGRSDNKEMTSDYPLGTTTVTWIFTDLSGNIKECSQVVKVEDWITDTLYCPSDLNNIYYSCITELPEPYKTFEEFKAAGGRISDESRIVKESFTYTDISVGSDCDYYVERTYSVKDIRNNEISCSQTLRIKDDVGPEFIGLPKDTIRISCTDEIPGVAVVTATDNCDDSPIVTMTEYNDRGKDPASCNYYNYVITRRWEAVDACENLSRFIQVIIITDDEVPTFDFPKDWKDTVLSIYRKGCEFGVPDFTVEVGAIVNDNCTDINQLKIYQRPAAGLNITESTNVYVYVEDLCGNVDSLSKYVLVPEAGSVVSLEAYNTELCGSDQSAIDLWSQTIRYAQGHILIEDWDGSYVEIESTFAYDCYKDSISEASLVYSNNPNTYYDKFYHPDRNVRDSIRASLINLRKQVQSGVYYFVAMDTITLCTDTAMANLTVNERPRLRKIGRASCRERV